MSNKHDEHVDEAVESTFKYLQPYPESNPRLISIHGDIPHRSEPGYDMFNEFLWLLIKLERDNRGKPITLVIDSPGGAGVSLDLLLDNINLMSSPIYTVAQEASSAAGILFIGGAKGHRYMFEHSTILLHNGKLLDKCPGHGWWLFKSYCLSEKERVEAEKEFDRAIRRYARMLDELTDGKLLESEETDEEKRVEAMMDLLYKTPVFGAQEAIKYGLADHVIGRKEFQDLFL